jgi:hypothetical protein
LDLGYAEALVDKKRLAASLTTTAKASADSTLLRILAAPDDVNFEKIAVDDFGVSICFHYIVISE